MTDQWWPVLLSSVVAPQLSDDQLPEAESSGQTVSHSSQFCIFGRFFTQKNRQKLEWSRGQNVLFDFHISHRTLAFSPSWFLPQQKNRWHKTCQISLGTGGAAKTDEFSEKIATRVSENEGGKGQRPFGTFPKIHPFWFLFFSRPFDSCHPSLKASSLAKDTHTW